MKGRLRHLLAGLVLGCAILILLTPLGPWLAAQLGQHLAPGYGWRLDIDRVGGRILGTARFEGVRLTSAADGVGASVTIRQLELAPWSFTAMAQAPDIQVTLSARPDSAPAHGHQPGPDPLPLDALPDITVTEGRFRLEQADGSSLTLEGVDLGYRGSADSTGLLHLAASAWTHSRGPEAGQTAAGRIESSFILAPRQISVQELRLVCQLDSSSVSVYATGSVKVESGWPLRAAADLSFVAGDTTMAESRVVIEGDLTPLHLGLHLEGHGSPAAWGSAAVVADLVLRPDTVMVRDLVIDVLDGQIGGNGSYLTRSGELTLQLNASQVKLDRWTGSAMGGRLGGSGRLHGMLNDGRYRADLDLDLNDLRLAGKSFDFVVDARLNSDKQFSMAVESTLGELKAEGELDPHGAYDLTLSGALQPEPLLGQPSAPVQVSGQVRPDTINTRLSMERLPLVGRDFGPVQLDLVWRSPTLEARLALEGDQLAVQLSMDAISGRLDTLVTVVKPLAMDRLLPDLAGTVSGQLAGNGSLSSEPRLSGRLELSDTAYKGWHTGPLSLQLLYEKGGARLVVSGAGLAGHAYLDSLTAYGGDLEFDNCQLHYLGTAEADTVVTLALSGAADWTGNLGASAGVKAAMNLPRFQLTGTHWQVAARQPLEAQVTEGLAQLATVEFSTPVGTLSLGGSFGAAAVDVVADMGSIDLDALDGPWQGTGKAALRLQGSPAKMRGTGFLQLTKAGFAEHDIGDISFQVGLDDSLSATLSLDQLAHPGSELTVDFSAPADAVFGQPSASVAPRFRLGTTASQLDLTPLLVYALADSVRGVLQATGVWQGSIRPGGVVSWEEVAGQLIVEQLEVEKPGVRLALIPGGQVRLDHGATHLEEMVFAVEVDDGIAVRPGGRVTVEGVVHASDANDLSLVVDKLDFAAIELIGAVTLPHGTIDLNAGLTGTGDEPQLEATFLSELSDYGDVVGSVRGDSFNLEMGLTGSTIIGDELELTATLPWNWPRRELNLGQGVLQTSSAGINLLMFLDQVPALEDVDGVVDLDLELRGFDAGAEIFGSIRVSDLDLRLIDVRPGYFFPAGEIQFAGKRGELIGFEGGPRKGNGSVRISGYLDLDQSGRIAYVLKVDGKDMPYNFDDVFDVSGIDVAMVFASTGVGAKISGSVALEGADIDLPLIDFNAPPVPPPPPTVQDPFLQGMELDLQLDIRDLHVENEITNVEAEGSTRVYGTFYKPLFQGEVLINEGKVFVLNNEFDFKPGRIGLDRLVPSYSILEIAYDPLLLNPELDLGAVTTIKPIDSQDVEEKYEITFLLQGPARQVEPRFESDPPLADQQLLMLVAFGSTQSMALFDQENRGALYSAAGQLLLSRQVKKIGLDEFQLLTSGTILETVGQPSLHIGKYVKWPLPIWLRYEGLTNDMSLGELRLEYKVRPYITVTGTSQSEQERYGMGMGIEKDF